jgi:hypothetical protein
MTQTKSSNWITALKDVTTNMNSSYNNSIGTSSDKVSKQNVSAVWHRLYDKVVRTKKVTPKYFVGDKVRVSIKKLLVGSKSFTETFGPEVFVIKSVLEYHPVPVYKLEDSEGKELEGGFNQFELVKVE